MGLEMPLQLSISRLPLMIFISILVGSLLLGCMEIYITVTTHSRGEYLRLENELIKVDFPRNWFAYSWNTENVTSGRIYSLVFSPPQSYSAIIFRIHDEQATQYYMKEFHLTNASSIVTFETERVRNWTLTKNENATVILKEKGGVIVSGNQADYSKIVIKDGIEYNGAFYNMSFMIISYLKNEKLIQIIFWGRGEDYDKSLITFNAVLNSTDIKV